MGILGREVDNSGLNVYVNALQKNIPLADVIRAILNSEEFKSNQSVQYNQSTTLINTISLPDLTELFPNKYLRKDAESSVFEVVSDDDYTFMESLIIKNRYYDSFGVWAPVIDLDKRVTAAIVQGLSAQSCLELGCFTGQVLSLLAEQGIDVCGVEISHLAFLLAYPNIHNQIRFGSLLELTFDKCFDVFLGMDILEHVNPLDLDKYIIRIAQLVNTNGFIYINSPMFGEDDIFGTVFEAYLPEWQHAGENNYWRHMHCDSKGWPMHGHLIWGSPKWWESMFLKHGLVRERKIEKAIHAKLNPFFDKYAPARKSLFVLRHASFNPNVEKTCRNLDTAISLALNNV